MRNKMLSGLFAVCGLLFSLTACGAQERPADLTRQTTPAASETEEFFEYTIAPAGQPATESAAEWIPAETVTQAETDYEIEPETLTETQPLTVDVTIDKDGVYTTKDDVALYIDTYGELPQNFITKKEAQNLGWTGGSLEPYAPGCCIGGSYFGNYEGNLPEKEGREYRECDIDTLGKSSRGAKRIVFSNDGLIYYTEDHYNTFELLYGEE